jgi:tetratricopeptide (TPR) repeat protein
MSVQIDRDEPNKRLETWKEIGAFLNRDPRTVRRWELERGLPVRRVPGSKSKVYAYAHELQDWLASGAADPEVDPASESRPNSMLGRRAGIVITAALALIVAGGGGFALWQARQDRAQSGAPAKRQPDPEARRLYLAGVTYWNTRTPEGLQRALDSFTQAVVRDPQYAEAYAGLAKTYNLLREYTLMPPEQAYPRARAAAQRAIALDDTLADAHTALAFVSFYWDWDAARARREFDRAIELDPRSAVARHWRATFLYHLRETDAALEEIDRAQELAPESTSILADRALILAQAGKTREALDLLSDLERSQPSFYSSHAYLAMIHEAQGDWARYVTELEHGARLRQDAAGLSLAAAARQGLESGGREGMYRGLLAEQLRLRARDRIGDLWIARTHARLGEREAALDRLAKAIAAHDGNIMSINVDPAFDALRSDPAYRRVTATLRLPQQRRG